MFFRFAAGLILVVLISMAGIAMERQTLEMKRAVSRQYFQKDLLLELHAKLRLRIQQLTAPSQLAARSPHSTTAAYRTLSEEKRRQQAPVSVDSRSPSARSSRLPLLKWEHPAPSTQ